MRIGAAIKPDIELDIERLLLADLGTLDRY